MPDQSTQTHAHGDVLTAISDGLVALLKEFYGRGPTQAKTYYHDDLVVCVLRGGFTRVEQTLLAGGRGAAVIEQRMAFQDVMRDRFEAVDGAGDGPVGRRLHERQSAGAGHDLRGLRAQPERPGARARAPAAQWRRDRPRRRGQRSVS